MPQLSLYARCVSEKTNLLGNPVNRLGLFVRELFNRLGARCGGRSGIIHLLEMRAEEKGC